MSRSSNALRSPPFEAITKLVGPYVHRFTFTFRSQRDFPTSFLVVDDNLIHARDKDTCSSLYTSGSCRKKVISLLNDSRIAETVHIKLGGRWSVKRQMMVPFEADVITPFLTNCKMQILNLLLILLCSTSDKMLITGQPKPN